MLYWAPDLRDYSSGISSNSMKTSKDLHDKSVSVCLYGLKNAVVMGNEEVNECVVLVESREDEMEG